MTNHWIDLKNSDCILIMGSNAAENHPISFKWVMKAVESGGTLIHVDPRFTRTSAKANIYARLRSGTDIAFLGGMIKYILDNFFMANWENMINSHPRYGERRFVLTPLAEVAPELCPANWQTTLPPDDITPLGPLVDLY
jgi:anaerobic selenocysteine-containing dehydrogenase